MTYVRVAIVVGGVLMASACASSAAMPPQPASATHLVVPHWVEGCAPKGDATSETIAAPRIVTTTIGAEGSSAPKWSGRKIDLDVKDADIHDVCRLLAEVGKTNIVVADDVHGSVTIKMKHVPWDQALEAILCAKGFDSMRDGDVILVVASAPK